MKAQSFGDESKAFSNLLRRRTLEINPHHQIIKDLNVSCVVSLQISLLKILYIQVFPQVILNTVVSLMYLFMYWCLQSMFNDDTSSTEAEKLADLLFETANLSSGFTVSLHCFMFAAFIVSFVHSHARTIIKCLVCLR